MLIFNQRLHISYSAKWPLSYKHNNNNIIYFIGHGIVPMRVPYKLHFAKLKFAH